MHSPSQLCPQTFLHDLTLLKIRPAPSPRSAWLPAHPHISVCLLSVFRSPLNCALAGQTHSARPKTQRGKVIEFPHLCQTHGAARARAGKRCSRTSEMLQLVNVSSRVVPGPWGTLGHTGDAFVHLLGFCFNSTAGISSINDAFLNEPDLKTFCDLWWIFLAGRGKQGMTLLHLLLDDSRKERGKVQFCRDWKV